MGNIAGGGYLRPMPPETDAEIAEWCSIADVVHDLKSARIGHFGWLKDDFRDSLWTEMADWLRATVE
jgi:predicted alpha/beta hydrolase